MNDFITNYPREAICENCGNKIYQNYEGGLWHHLDMEPMRPDMEICGEPDPEEPPVAARTDFITELTKQLRAWQDETNWLQPYHVQEMVIQAARAVIEEGQQTLSNITLKHEVEVGPDELELITVLEFGDDGERFFLFAPDVATLRALLAFWNENRGIEVGMPLTMPVKLADGRIVSEVVAELLEDEND